MARVTHTGLLVDDDGHVVGIRSPSGADRMLLFAGAAVADGDNAAQALASVAALTEQLNAATAQLTSYATTVAALDARLAALETSVVRTVEYAPIVTEPAVSGDPATGENNA